MSRRAGKGVALFGSATLMAASLAGNAGAAPTNRSEERAAIETVRSFEAALVAKDIERALSYTDDAIQYRDDPFQVDLKKGRTQLADDLKMLLRGLNGVTVQDAYAVGSAKNDVLVLVRRVDVFTLGGKRIEQPMGGYFRVREGKILEWLDTPLAQMPTAPAGGLPPGGPPPAR